MQAKTKREKIIIEELRQIPEEVMPEIINILRSFKKGIQTISTSKQQISKNSGLCGIWKDERSANEILKEIHDSRTGFSTKSIEL
jgi:hypothetical protein